MTLNRAKPNRAVFMDRDGTVIKDSHYLSDPEGVQIYKGVIGALKQLEKKGWNLIIGTNQSGVARGYFTMDAVERIHRKFLSICRKNGVNIRQIFVCPHHPGDLCRCRKPKTGMLTDAAKKFNLDLKECVVVGDKKCDIEWGRKVGARTVLVLTGKGRRTRAKGNAKPHHVSRSLPHAARWILDNV